MLPDHHEDSVLRKRIDPSPEDGQVMIMVGLVAIVLFGVVGLSIDTGRIYVNKAQLSRAVDAAALAGALELPAIDDACATANAYLAENESSATPDCTVPGDNQLKVTASKSVKLYFLPILNYLPFGFDFDLSTVSAKAVAGFGTQPVDAVLVIDSTNSMQGTPITEAKNAAKNFVNVLIGPSPSGFTQVGATPFRGCYNPPRSRSECVDAAGAGNMVTELTTNKSTLISGIDAIDAQGGSGTNLCSGLKKGQDIMFGPAAQTTSNTRRYLVVLSDGDNNYSGSVAYSSSENSPDPACRPTTTPLDQNEGNGGCSSDDRTRERQLDSKTYELATTMKTTQNVEIFVVAFGVCQNTPGLNCNTSYVGTTTGNNTDNVRDQNLLKCIASSSPSTNDHYYYASSASDLPAIFTTIATQIAHRLIE